MCTTKPSYDTKMLELYKAALKAHIVRYMNELNEGVKAGTLIQAYNRVWESYEAYALLLAKRVFAYLVFMLIVRTVTSCWGKHPWWRLLSKFIGKPSSTRVLLGLSLMLTCISSMSPGISISSVIKKHWNLVSLWPWSPLTSNSSQSFMKSTSGKQLSIMTRCLRRIRISNQWSTSTSSTISPSLRNSFRRNLFASIYLKLNTSNRAKFPYLKVPVLIHKKCYFNCLRRDWLKIILIFCFVIPTDCPFCWRMNKSM